MVVSILARAAILSSFLALSACGGGGDEAVPEQRTAQAAAVDFPLATCQAVAPANGIEVQRVTVPADVYAYPHAFGVQDRTFGPITYANTTGATEVVQVTISSSRQLTTPASMAGQTNLDLAVSGVDITANALIDPSATACDPAIENAGAGEARTASELRRFNITIPPGHTVTFTSIARVAPNVGSTGSVTLTTTALDFSVVKL